MNHQPTHIAVTSAELAAPQAGGRFFFLPGSPARAARIAEHFEERRTYPSQRGHDVHTGHLTGTQGPVHVGAVSTGMGCPSVGIIVTELVELGVRRLLRIGSAGGLQPNVHVGDVVIATGGVRDEGASNAFAPLEFPAVAGWRMNQALVLAAGGLLEREAFHVGPVHSKDSLHGREFGYGPLRPENERYMQQLMALGVVGSEMEASHLFVLAHALRDKAQDVPPDEAPIEAGCCLAILGGIAGSSDEQARDRAEANAIQVGLEAARRMIS